MQERIPAFDDFVAALRDIWTQEQGAEQRMEQARPMMVSLLHDDELFERSRAWPPTEGGVNLDLYEDPDHRFMINSVVRVPGLRGNPHDHDRQWVLYGVLDGLETLERYERLDDGSREDYAELRLTSAPEGRRGSVDIVHPFEIHAEQGGPHRSVSIIVRSERIGPDMRPARYRLEGNVRMPGSGPSHVPFALHPNSLTPEAG
jgi:predicted metal-dependent enzyme (double-stranded beta helix superfamily)